MNTAIPFDPHRLIPRERPRFAEAYPRLNFIKAQKAIHEGRTICVFERPGRGRVGQFQFGYYEQDEGVERGLLHGLTEMFPDYHLMGNYTKAAFRIRPSRIGVNHHRDFVLCSECRRPKVVLVFVESWQCRKCQGLLFRSQLIDPNIRLAGKALEIEDPIRKGRPKGMHNATYRRKLEEVKQLRSAIGITKARLGDVAAYEHDRIVEARWVSPAEDVDWLRLE